MNPAPSAAADNPHDASASPPTGARKKASGSIAKRACDQCKFRKIKCSLSQPCRACLSMGFECTFYQPQKKRGPTGHRVSQIRQQQTTHLAQKSPQPRTQAQAQAQTQTQTQTQAQAQAQAHSPGSAADAFAYPTGPSPAAAREPGRMEAIPMPEAAAAAAQWPVQTPMNGNGLASATTATAPVGADWTAGVPAAPPLDPHTHGAMSWGKYGDAEYWLPDNLDAQVPIFDFPGTNVYLKPSLPSMVQAESDAPDMESHQASPTSSTSIPISSLTPHPPEEDSRPRSVWPPSIIEANMIPWIDVYFDRLHPTLPVINRSSLFIRMLSQEHRRNPQFGAMLLSLCAFSLTQPIEIDERPTSSSRAGQARSMMHEATKMRSCSDFGEHPTIEAVLTSFFLFGCLFGSNQHNAAWLRLREALDLAATLGLNDPNCYPELSSEEKGQRLRTYLVLSITERAYALQRQHPITFRGKPGFTMRSVHEFIHSASHRLVSGIIVHNEHDAEGMMGLARLMELFDAIDEEVVDCWNRRCHIDSGYCEKLTAAKALEIHQNLGRLNTAERYKGYDWFERTKSAPHEAQAAHQGVGLRETQCADIFITQKWLQNRLWVLCSTHGLLTPVSDHVELTLNFAILIANDTLQICKSLRIGSMEAHGIGIVEKIFDIITSALDISASINPSLGGSNFAASSLCQGLAGDYMLLLTSLRGGNHPFLERYRAYLGSLASASASSSAVGAGWGQQ